MGFTFLTGGARSGKSALALALVSAHRGPVTFIATAEARDEEMRARIATHRSERPLAWTTIEEPIALERAVACLDDNAAAVLDCLTLWVANLLEAGADDERICARANEVVSVLAARDAPAIVVSNEIGSGLVPMEQLSRRYRDLLGRVNAIFSLGASSAFLVVAGRAMVLAPIAELQ